MGDITKVSENRTTHSQTPLKKIRKLFWFIVLALIFEWIFVMSGMTFEPTSEIDPLTGIAEILQPILSPIPKSLFILAEFLPLPWPFVIGSMILKFLILIILVGIPFFFFYLLARYKTGVKPKILGSIFVGIGLLSITPFFLPSSPHQYTGPTKTIKQVNRICMDDIVCKNAIYGSVMKNSYFGKYRIKDGTEMPFLSSLRGDMVFTALIPLSKSVRESYCNEIYVGPRMDPDNFKSCKEKLGLTP